MQPLFTSILVPVDFSPYSAAALRYASDLADRCDASVIVLHVIASGPGEYQGNQIETTFLSNVALVDGRTYEVSLRAKWLSGGARLNTRLYFNKLPRTNLLSITLSAAPRQPPIRGNYLTLAPP